MANEITVIVESKYTTSRNLLSRILSHKKIDLNSLPKDEVDLINRWHELINYGTSSCKAQVQEETEKTLRIPENLLKKLIDQNDTDYEELSDEDSKLLKRWKELINY